MNYTKWLITTCSVLILSVVLHLQFDIFTYLMDLDTFGMNTYVCFSTVAVFLSGIAYAGYTSFYDATNKDTLDRHGFICTCLGLLGTFLGLLQLFEVSLSLESSSVESIKTVMTDLMAGLGLAFKTTIVGLMCNITLSVYSLLIGVKNE